MRARVSVCVCVCVRERERECVCVRARVAAHMAMKRSSFLLSGGCRLLSSQKPWCIYTCHSSNVATLSPSDTCHPSYQSRVPTWWSKWPTSPPSSVARHGTTTPKLLPKLMHPFNGSMFTPPLLIQENMHPLEEKHDPTNTLSNGPMSLPSLGHKCNHKNNIDNQMVMSKMRRLLQLAQLDALKERLEKEAHDIMPYDELLNICINMGVSSSPEGAMLVAKCLDDAGVIFIFQDTVYLKPKKIAQLISEVMPLPLSRIKERESILQEISRLEQEKDEIDKLAYNHSHKVLWSGFGFLILQMALIFRFTFWELSWDVMEPIAYFVTNITLLLGYAFFMFTSRHPTYKDVTTILMSSKKKRLMKARKFDISKLLQLQKQIGLPNASLV